MDIDQGRFPLIHTVGGYDKAYMIINNQPKYATRYNPKCYKVSFSIVTL